MIGIFFFASTCHLSSHHWPPHPQSPQEIIPKGVVMTEGTRWPPSVYNIKVFNTCQMSFWLSKKNLLFCFVSGALHKNVLCKVPRFTRKASQSACHKIQWLQFAHRNIVGLQSWHSIKHFQIPITHVI